MKNKSEDLIFYTRICDKNVTNIFYPTRKTAFADFSCGSSNVNVLGMEIIMNNLNYVLFEEYKRLDKLCGDIYKTQHGITSYIDDMKAKSLSDYRCIPHWGTDLEWLIKIRHIRNSLAHAEDAFNTESCTQNDIDWIRDFYNRILNQSDPIAILYQNSKAKNQLVKKSNSYINKPVDKKINNQIIEQSGSQKVRQTNYQENEELNNQTNTEMNIFIWIAIIIIIFIILVSGALA